MGPTSARAIVCTDHAQSLIRIKARQLCRRHDFSASEQDDIQQELWLRLVARAHHFDPARGPMNTFIERVVSSGVCTILRQRRRQQRLPWFQALSLEDTMLEIDGTTTPIVQAISAEDLYRRLGTTATDAAKRYEDTVLLNDALRSMSRHLCSLCERLSNGSAHSAARSLNISRRQLRNAIDVIREHLERVGLGFL